MKFLWMLIGDDLAKRRYILERFYYVIFTGSHIDVQTNQVHTKTVLIFVQDVYAVNAVHSTKINLPPRGFV